MLVFILILRSLYDIGGTSIKGISLKNLVFYISFIVVLLSEMFYKRKIYSIIPGFYTLIILLTWSFFSLFWGAYFLEKKVFINAIINYKSSFFDCILLYCISCIFFTEFKYASKGLQFFIISFSLLNVLALSYFFTGFNPFKASLLSHQGTRFASFGRLANQGAYALEFLLPLLCYFAITSKSKISKLIYVFFIGTSILGILLTGSRGGYILLIVEIIYIGILIKKYYRFKFYLSAIFIGLVLCIGFYIYNPSFVKENLFRVEAFKASSLEKVSSGRIIMWKGILKILEKDPIAILIGKGWGTYQYYIPKTIGFYAAAHNIFLKLLLEVGLVGMIFFVVFLFRFYQYITKEAKKDKLYYYFSFLSFLTILFGWNLGLFENIIYFLSLGVGLCVNYIKTK